MSVTMLQDDAAPQADALVNAARTSHKMVRSVAATVRAATPLPILWLVPAALTSASACWAASPWMMVTFIGNSSGEPRRVGFGPNRLVASGHNSQLSRLIKIFEGLLPSWLLARHSRLFIDSRPPLVVFLDQPNFSASTHPGNQAGMLDKHSNSAQAGNPRVSAKSSTPSTYT